MKKTDVENNRDKEILVAEESNQEKKQVKNLRIRKYICGRAFRRTPDGQLLSLGYREKGSGRFGYETKVIRIPLPLVPFVESILEKCAELETIRRNIVFNIYNSSPDLLALEKFSKGVLDLNFDKEV